MRILITGASGFVGRYIALSALARGHQVRAQIRPASSLDGIPWAPHNSVEICRADLRSEEGLLEMLIGIDAVVHSALSKQGGRFGSLAANLVGTENLLKAMQLTHVSRLVHISSFSVYNYSKLRAGSRLDEMSDVEIDPDRRDYYCTTKLLQERLVLDAAKKGIRTTIVRPGAIFGADKIWTDRIGLKLSPRTWILFGGLVRIPLTYVENCAEAIVMCAETEKSTGMALNIVDDETPTQQLYARLLRKHLDRPPRLFHLPWLAILTASRLAFVLNEFLFRGRLRLPQVLNPPSIQARFKPLRYPNQALKNAVGWKPRFTLEEALERCFIK